MLPSPFSDGGASEDFSVFNCLAEIPETLKRYVMEPLNPENCFQSIAIKVESI